MSWVRLDDGFYDDPTIESVGLAGAMLYLAGWCFSAKHLTDGVIPEGRARRLTADQNPDATIRALLDTGLWQKVDGGYLAAPHLVHVRSAEEVKRDREETARRQAEWRDRRRTPEPVSNGVTHSVTNGRGTPLVTGAPSRPVPARPGPLEIPDPAPEKDEDDAPEARASAAAGTSEARKAVGDLLVGEPGFRESAAFWAELDAMAEWVPLRLELVKALDWIRSKKKRQVTSRFLLNWMQKEVARAKRERAEEALAVDEGEPPEEWFEPHPRDVDPAAETVWAEVATELRSRMNGPNHSAYVAHCRGVAFEGERLVVVVDNPLLLDGLARFKPLMLATLSDLSGKPADIRLVAS